MYGVIGFRWGRWAERGRGRRGHRVCMVFVLGSLAVLAGVWRRGDEEPVRGGRDRTPVLFIRWSHWDSSAIMLHTWIGDPKPILYKGGPYWVARWSPRTPWQFAAIQGLRPYLRLILVTINSEGVVLRREVLLRGSRRGFPQNFAWHPVLPVLAVEVWYPADTNPFRYLDTIRYLPDIVVYNVQTRKLMWILGHPKLVEYQPAWDGTGQWLAFISNAQTPPSDTIDRTPHLDVYVVPFRDPSAARAWTRHGKALKSLTWVPDKQAILYYSQGREAGPGIYWLEPATNTDSLFIPFGYAPAWSPSRRYLLYRYGGPDTRKLGLWVWDRQTGEHWRLTRTRDNFPSWAPWQVLGGSR